MLAQLSLVILSSSLIGGQPEPLATNEGDFTVHDYRFADGETMPELHVHYTTLAQPVKDASGKVTNAVLIMHGTGGTGHQFITPIFSGVLFGKDQLLSSSKFFIILPDAIGHGKSSKPSDGLHAKFPKYGYRDIVDLQHRMITEGLGVNHLRLVMGTSMGGMQTWMWGETYPDFMDALMPLASLPVEIAGRNRMTRRMIIDAINRPGMAGWRIQDPTSLPHRRARHPHHHVQQPQGDDEAGPHPRGRR